MKPLIKENKQIAIALSCCLLLFLIQFLPYVLRADAYIRIHDTLEGEWLWFSSLVDLEVAMDYNMSTTVETYFGGIPRYLFPSGLSFTVLFISLFGTVGGYVVSSFVVHLIAFTGSYLLFKNYIFSKKDERHWAVLIASLFSIIPFFITLGISVAGQPLLLYAFLNILNRRGNYWEYGFILLFPFYSTIHWAILFVNLLVLVAFISSYSRQYAKIRFLLMLGLMNMVYLAINYHLIHAMFISDLVLHRVEYTPTIKDVPNLLKSVGETFYMFFVGSYHVGTFVTFPIFVLGCFCINNKVIRYLLFLAFGIALLNGFYLYIVPLLEKIHPLLISFKITRIKILLPMIWMTVLGLSIRELIRSPRGAALSYFVLACLIVSTLFANDEIINNYRNLLGCQKKPDARQFFAMDTMNDIAIHIGKDKSAYRVAHLGMNPTISQHSGFQTIDGLQAMYPLEHKHVMKRIMQAELDKDKRLLLYFNAWGNRCYLFSTELGKENNAFMIDKTQDVAVNEWSVNTKLLKESGVEYLFSTVDIRNYKALSLQLEGSFENERDYWKINLYKLN